MEKRAMHFGDRLKQIRNENGRSQVWMARKLGIDVSTIKRYESNSHEPTITMLLKLCKIFAVTPNDLLMKDPEDIQMAIKKHQDFIGKLDKLPPISIEHYYKLVTLELNELVVIKANKPIKAEFIDEL